MKTTLSLQTLGAVFLLLAATGASAQTPNAYDTDANPAYANTPAPNGLTSGLNGGYGFGPWTFDISDGSGNGGAFSQPNSNVGSAISPSGQAFDLWNTGQGYTSATRSFDSPLSPGESFSFITELQGLESANQQNIVELEDSSGNVLFSYWHQGFESNSSNGEYTDAGTSSGTAVNFGYNYNAFSSFTFTLNSASSKWETNRLVHPKFSRRSHEVNYFKMVKSSEMCFTGNSDNTRQQSGAVRFQAESGQQKNSIKPLSVRAGDIKRRHP